ncbi:DUF2225 domain-containing protein [Spirochaetota bacterium]
MENQKTTSKVSFFQKTPIKCPVCEKEFLKETLLSGRGRLIADDMMIDLRRRYQPSPKFGVVNPLIYSIVTCPHCLYSTFPEDFMSIKEENIKRCKEKSTTRKKHCKTIFNAIFNFSKPKNLYTGAASYLLALDSYAYHDKESAPSLKRAIASIRASWLYSDISQEKKGEYYEYLVEYFRYLAWKCYYSAIDAMQTGIEVFDNVKRFGPDTDKDYGYDGALYLRSYLTYEMRFFIKNKDEKIKYYLDAKRTLSKVFGLGKATKEKPGPLLDIARFLYDKLKYELDDLDANEE